MYCLPFQKKLSVSCENIEKEQKTLRDEIRTLEVSNIFL